MFEFRTLRFKNSKNASGLKLNYPSGQVLSTKSKFSETTAIITYSQGYSFVYISAWMWISWTRLKQKVTRTKTVALLDWKICLVVNLGSYCFSNTCKIQREFIKKIQRLFEIFNSHRMTLSMIWNSNSMLFYHPSKIFRSSWHNYKNCRFGNWENIPGGRFLISFDSRLLQ